ncbi:hypothetical protein Ddye_026356 [Dipteronia dyeriana]|uniref:Uncharacterized protein n=1 Tax=Dipteronia dyeriana TaxID=168575 RepID=A0AAD9TM47_9ROSI|nr:hypothetical protein Ddye_026356 [Dipteronia dyeriana]
MVFLLHLKRYSFVDDGSVDDGDDGPSIATPSSTMDLSSIFGDGPVPFGSLAPDPFPSHSSFMVKNRLWTQNTTPMLMNAYFTNFEISKPKYRMSFNLEAIRKPHETKSEKQITSRSVLQLLSKTKSAYLQLRGLGWELLVMTILVRVPCVPNRIDGFAGMAFASVASIGSLRLIRGGSLCNRVDRFS